MFALFAHSDTPLILASWMKAQTLAILDTALIYCTVLGLSLGYPDTLCSCSPVPKPTDCSPPHEPSIHRLCHYFQFLFNLFIALLQFISWSCTC